MIIYPGGLAASGVFFVKLGDILEITADLLRKSTFSLDVVNFEKWNPGGDKHRRWIKLDVNFLEDPKITRLSAAETLVFIGLMVARARVGGRLKLGSVLVVSRLTHARAEVVSRSLVKLLELRLIDLTDLEPTRAREDKIREDKIRKDTRDIQKTRVAAAPETPVKTSEPQATPATRIDPASETRPTWEAYIESYITRYKVPPTRNATTNAQMKQFVKRVGAEDAPGIVGFYLKHNDFLYVKTLHPVNLMLRDAEGLRTQWLKGKAVTSSDARESEKTDRLQSQLQRIANGELGA